MIAPSSDDRSHVSDASHASEHVSERADLAPGEQDTRPSREGRRHTPRLHRAHDVAPTAAPDRFAPPDLLPRQRRSRNEQNGESERDEELRASRPGSARFAGRRAPTALADTLWNAEEAADAGEQGQRFALDRMERDALLTAIPDPALLCDRLGRMLEMNAQAAALLGFDGALSGVHGQSGRHGRNGYSYSSTSSASSGQSGWRWPAPLRLPELLELREPDGSPLVTGYEPLLQAIAAGRPFERRYLVWGMVGGRIEERESLVAHVRCAPVRDALGGVTGAAIVLRDVGALDRMERQRDEFLSVVSHELKTPLTSMKLLLELTRRRLTRAGLSEDEYLTQMERSLKRMELFVGDLLEVSHIELGRLPLRLASHDLRAICREATGDPLLGGRAIELELPKRPLPARVDAERLEQALVNLLSNADKFSAPERPVALALHRRRGEALLTVRDEGIGIPAEALPHLFEPFYRAPHVQTQGTIGLGLGLFITREIVQRHGGRIWVESHPGVGSAFHIALPVETIEK